MNKQRKVLITTTYNEMGIIIDTKAEEVAQPERILYANMSDAEFEKWLYEHGICNPNIHESIPCDAVPLLIDNAISELPSAQPEIIRCKDCKHRDPEDKKCDCGMQWCAFPKRDDDFCSYAERREDG